MSQELDQQRVVTQHRISPDGMRTLLAVSVRTETNRTLTTREGDAFVQGDPAAAKPRRRPRGGKKHHNTTKRKREANPANSGPPKKDGAGGRESRWSS